MGISTGIAKLAKLTGTGCGARITLGKAQLLKAAGKNNTKAGQELAKAFDKMKNPKMEAAFKASERGYTVGAFTLRDGKKVIANGAGSITDLGKENPVIKMRLNVGENGDIFRYNGFVDLSHTPRVQDIEVSSTLRKGIYEMASQNGKAGADRVRLDIPKAVEAAGVKDEGALFAKQVNKSYEKYTEFIRDIFSGKVNL